VRIHDKIQMDLHKFCLPNIFVPGDGYQTMDHSWLGVRKGNIQTISFGWGQNDWDSILHCGPPHVLFKFLVFPPPFFLVVIE
jgi:hypothetical protein